MSDFLIGVDIGTQGTKAALFSADGTCHASAFRASKLHRPGPGRVEEDPEDQVKSVFATIRKCLSDSGVDNRSVAGVAVAGQMAGVIGIGRDGRAVTPYDSWLDTRCAPQIDRMRKKCGEEIIEKTGGPASFNHGPKILWWKKIHPGIFRSTAAFVQPSGYAAMRLCGLDAASAFIDRTYLHFSGFAHNTRNVWDDDLCRAFGIGPEKLPRIVASHEMIGEVSAGSASGLRRGGGVRRHGREFPCLRSHARKRLRRRGRNGVGLRGDDPPVSPGCQIGHSILRPIRGARPVASLCLHQRRRHEPRVV